MFVVADEGTGKGEATTVAASKGPSITYADIELTVLEDISYRREYIFALNEVYNYNIESGTLFDVSFSLILMLSLSWRLFSPKEWPISMPPRRVVRHSVPFYHILLFLGNHFKAKFSLTRRDCSSSLISLPRETPRRPRRSSLVPSRLSSVPSRTTGTPTWTLIFRKKLVDWSTLMIISRTQKLLEMKNSPNFVDRLAQTIQLKRDKKLSADANAVESHSRLKEIEVNMQKAVPKVLLSFNAIALSS